MTRLLKVAFIGLAVIGLTVRAWGRDGFSEVEKLYDQTFGKGLDHQHVRNLTLAQREQLRVYSRSKIEDMKRSGMEDAAHIADSESMLHLALLGDDWAREQVVKSFWNQSRGYASELHYLKDPKVIAMTGDGLFMEEEWYQRGDVRYKPTQETIAEVVIDTLGNSPEFTADVINWARRVDQWAVEDGSRELKIVRDWYRANEVKLKAGDFKAVQPGAEPPDRKASAPAGGAPSSRPPGSKPATAPASFPGNVQSPESSGNVYAWIAALLLTICGGLVWLLKRKRI